MTPWHRYVRCGIGATALVLSWVGTGTAQVSSPAPILVSERRVAVLAVEHNLALAAARVDAQEADVAVARASTVWTPQFLLSSTGTNAQLPAPSLLAGAQDTAANVLYQSEVGLTQRLPFGAQYRVAWDAAQQSTNNALVRFNPQVTSTLAIEVVQPLVRGMSFDADRAQLAIARVEQRHAAKDLAGAVATAVRTATRAYWQWVYAGEVLSVEQESSRLAKELLENNRERVAIGAMAAVDLTEAEAEVARRDEAILVAARTVKNAEAVLKRMVLGAGDDTQGATLLRVADEDVAPTSTKAQIALDERVDVLAAEAAVGIAQLSIRRFKDEMRPDVSLKLRYAAQGLSGTELLRSDGFPGTVIGSSARTFSSALADLTSGRYPTWTAQVLVAQPIGTSRAKTDFVDASLAAQRARISVDDAKLAARTEQTIAQRNVEVSLERLNSTQKTVELASQRLSGEQRKFTTGLSTSFFVFQAQRDLAFARQARLRAMLDYRLSRADLDAVRVIPLGLDQVAIQ